MAGAGVKCLSLWQPWASALFARDPDGNRLKPDETRGWSTVFRGELAIHAAQKEVHPGPVLAHSLRVALGQDHLTIPFGCIVGVLTITDVRPAVLVALERTPMQLQWGDYRDVGEDGNHRYALITAQPRLLKEPVLWKGRQGFFRVPDDLFPPEAFVR